MSPYLVFSYWFAPWKTRCYRVADSTRENVKQVSGERHIVIRDDYMTSQSKNKSYPQSRFSCALLQEVLIGT